MRKLFNLFITNVTRFVSHASLVLTGKGPAIQYTTVSEAECSSTNGKVVLVETLALKP